MVDHTMERYTMEHVPEGYFVTFPECMGVWALGETPEAALAEAREVLEDWFKLMQVAA